MLTGSSHLPADSASRVIVCLFGVAPDGGYRVSRPPGGPGLLVSVALFLASRRPAVSRHPALWSPDFPLPFAWQRLPDRLSRTNYKACACLGRQICYPESIGCSPPSSRAAQCCATPGSAGCFHRGRPSWSAAFMSGHAPADRLAGTQRHQRVPAQPEPVGRAPGFAPERDGIVRL